MVDQTNQQVKPIRRRGAQPGNKNATTTNVTSAVRALRQRGKLYGRKHMAALVFIGKCTRIVANSLGYSGSDAMSFLDQRDLGDYAFLRWKVETLQAQALGKCDPNLNSDEIRADIRSCHELSARLRKSRSDALDISPSDSLRRQYPASHLVPIIPEYPESAQDDSEEGEADMDE